MIVPVVFTEILVNVLLLIGLIQRIPALENEGDRSRASRDRVTEGVEVVIVDVVGSSRVDAGAREVDPDDDDGDGARAERDAVVIDRLSESARRSGAGCRNLDTVHGPVPVMPPLELLTVLRETL